MMTMTMRTIVLLVESEIVGVGGTLASLMSTQVTREKRTHTNTQIITSFLVVGKGRSQSVSQSVNTQIVLVYDFYTHEFLVFFFLVFWQRVFFFSHTKHTHTCVYDLFCFVFFVSCCHNNTKHINNSGLAVQPNVDDNDRDRVFGLAENATADDSSQVRRTITMVRQRFWFLVFFSHFCVCDGKERVSERERDYSTHKTHLLFGVIFCFFFFGILWCSIAMDLLSMMVRIDD